MANPIDVILDAQNETTPIFTIYDSIVPGVTGGATTGRMTVQAVRTTNGTSNAVFGLERCALRADGSLLQYHPQTGTDLVDAWVWQQETLMNFDAATERTHAEVGSNNYILWPGFAYRIRRTSTGTEPIRIVVQLEGRPSSI